MKYRGILNKIKNYQEHPPASLPFYHPRVDNVLNGMEQGKYTTVGGRANSGKASFVDFYYVITMVKTYLEQDISTRKPLQILYYELKDDEEKKMMKWTACYLMVKDKKLTDVNTLRNLSGKSFQYDSSLEATLEANSDFFDDLEQHVDLKCRPFTATDIYMDVKDYIQSIGSYEDNIFKYDPEHAGQVTMVIVNNTARLRPELDNYQTTLNKDQVQTKLHEYMQELVDKFKISPVIVHSTPDVGLIGKGVPTLKDLGVFGTQVTQGIVMYTPFNYGNNNYVGYDIREFIINHKNRFKTMTVLRNNYGIDNATIPLIFLGEASYFRECPRPTDSEALTTIMQQLGRIN